jgi:hypothetical protein
MSPKYLVAEISALNHGNERMPSEFWYHISVRANNHDSYDVYFSLPNKMEYLFAIFPGRVGHMVVLMALNG